MVSQLQSILCAKKYYINYRVLAFYLSSLETSILEHTLADAALVQYELFVLLLISRTPQQLFFSFKNKKVEKMIHIVAQ